MSKQLDYCHVKRARLYTIHIHRNYRYNTHYEDGMGGWGWGSILYVALSYLSLYAIYQGLGCWIGSTSSSILIYQKFINIHTLSILWHDLGCHVKISKQAVYFTQTIVKYICAEIWSTTYTCTCTLLVHTVLQCYLEVLLSY